MYIYYISVKDIIFCCFVCLFVACLLPCLFPSCLIYLFVCFSMMVGTLFLFAHWALHIFCFVCLFDKIIKIIIIIIIIITIIIYS